MEEGTSKAPECSSIHPPNLCQETVLNPESATSEEIISHKLDINLPINPEVSSKTIKLYNMPKANDNQINASSPKMCNSSNHCPQQLFLNPRIIITPELQICSNLPSQMSLNTPLLNHPKSLYLIALAKLNESSISLELDIRTNIPKSPLLKITNNTTKPVKSPELTPPGSLTSAPPSYSFVLRQMAVRRRPRLMGTFIPSPSFVQHTPPPNYATAFDIYVDNPLPQPPTRIYHFGFSPMPVVCSECGYTGLTMTRSKITLCTHLCAFILCLLCCWICAPLPYLLRSCKDVYHYCRNCRNFLGMYCPTNPENAYS